jgi:hypothetical protein
VTVTGVPVLLLDVDGPINANRPGWAGPPRTATATTGPDSFRIRFAPALIVRLCALHHSGLVEVRWATTWADHIGEIVRITGLPDSWPVAFTLAGRPVTEPAAALKYAAAVRVVHDERRPLIWVDDDAIPDEGSPELTALLSAGPPVLIVRPRSTRGLQSEHLDEIESFAADLIAGRRAYRPEF